MFTIIAILHVLVCVFLILVVLLQTGRGSEIGAVFGGGASQTLFGSPGAAGFLTKITTAAAVVFMITSLLLAFWSTPKRVDLILEQPVSEETVPAGEEEIPQEVP